MNMVRLNLPATVESKIKNQKLFDQAIREVLAPLQQIVEDQRYNLSAEHLVASEVATALGTIAPCPVGFLSLDYSMPEPSETDEAYRSRTQISDTLSSVLGNRYGQELFNALGEEAFVAFGRWFHGFLGEKFLTTFATSVADTIWRIRLIDALFEVFSYNIATPTIYALGFALVGDESRYAQIAPVAKLLTSTMPLGLSASEPRKWIVMVK